MNSKDLEEKQQDADLNLSRIPFTKYIDLGTKENPQIQNKLRVFYNTIKDLHDCALRVSKRGAVINDN